MDLAQQPDNSKPAVEKLSEEYIIQSKYVLNAALIEVLRDKNPRDVQAARQTIFELLESEDHELESIKYSMIDGRFLDAADELSLLAKRSHEKAGDLYLKAAVIYAPFLSVKSLSAFENAEAKGANLTGHHRQLSALYSRVGEHSKADKHKALAAEFEDGDQAIAGVSVENDNAGRPFAGELRILPITIARDGRQKFAQNLKLEE